METTLAAAEELSGDDELQTHFFEDAMLGMNVADGMSSPPKSLVDDEVSFSPITNLVEPQMHLTIPLLNISKLTTTR